MSEPNIRSGQPAVALSGTVTVYGLTPGANYVLYRYDSTDALPSGPPYNVGFDTATPFTAKAANWTYADPKTFLSSSAVYYVAVAA